MGHKIRVRTGFDSENPTAGQAAGQRAGRSLEYVHPRADLEEAHMGYVDRTEDHTGYHSEGRTGCHSEGRTDYRMGDRKGCRDSGAGQEGHRTGCDTARQGN